MATVAAMVGRKLPENAGEDSYNLLPALLGKDDKPIREAIVHHSNLGIFAIRRGDWKLELGLGSGGFSPPNKVDPAEGGPVGQLYNLAQDPGENFNLYQRHPEIVEELSRLLDQYRRQGYSRPM
jgi:arylsulfatase A